MQFNFIVTSATPGLLISHTIVFFRFIPRLVCLTLSSSVHSSEKSFCYIAAYDGRVLHRKLSEYNDMEMVIENVTVFVNKGKSNTHAISYYYYPYFFAELSSPLQILHQLMMKLIHFWFVSRDGGLQNKPVDGINK